MVLFLVLEIGRSWNEGKAFFFCAIISSVLLGATRIEGPLIKIFTIKGYQGGFDPFILKMAVFIVIAVVIIYFVFIDDS